MGIGVEPIEQRQGFVEPERDSGSSVAAGVFFSWRVRSSTDGYSDPYSDAGGAERRGEIELDLQSVEMFGWW